MTGWLSAGGGVSRRVDRQSTREPRVGPAARSRAAVRWAIVGMVAVVAAAGSVAAQQGDTPARAPTVAEAEAMEARLQAAIRVDPSIASLHASLGELYRSQARLPEARDAFAEAVRLEPMNPAFRRDLARAHLALDEFADAEVHFAWGSELAPQDPAMYTGLAEALLGQGRPADAEAAVDRAATLDPSSAEVERVLALIREAPDADDVDAGTPRGIGRTVGRLLTYLFAVGMTIAGLGLLLPVGAAVVVLLLLLPRALLQRPRG